jgi:hypothetical protein
MGSPFHFKKKERKRRRRSAQKAITWAEKREAEGVKPEFAALSRRMAAFDERMSLARRREKTKSKNPK